MAAPNKETEEDWVLGALLPSRRWSGALNILAGSVLPCPKQKRAGQWAEPARLKLVVNAKVGVVSDGELTTASRQGEEPAASHN